MKYKQGLYFEGYISISVEGKRPEIFLNKCMHEDIPIWDVKRKGSDKFEAKVHLKNLSRVKKIRRELGYKISFKDKFGLPFLLAHLKVKKPLVIGLLLGLLFIFTLSNVVWQVKITGVSPEMEYKIKQRLDHYGIKQGIFKFSVGSLEDIERNITNELKDVMWVGIEEKGTTYIVQGVEKTIVNKEEQNAPQHLVATREGEIVKILVETGDPLVKVHQHVDKGDRIVSGIIGQNKSENENEEKEQNNNQQRVHAEGKVYAKTWYTTETIVPLEYEYKTLTGNKDEHYKLSLGSISIPIWDFISPNYQNTFEEKEKQSLYFLNFKLPFKVEKNTIYEQETIKGKRTEKKAIEEGIAQAKRELKKQMDYDAEIVNVTVLHNELQNGKVKLNLSIEVIENIAKPQPIAQGE
jgi:similar to stage IV sporulation protein